MDLKTILSSTKKHKEKVALLTEQARKDKNLVTQLFELLKTGKDVERGTCAEVLKFVSKERPEMVVPYIDILVEYIDYQAPRVKWGCPESLGYLAKQYPEQVEKAIPKLMANLKDKSTVVRWCAAFALTEIAKSNSKQQADLMGKFEDFIRAEKNNGVKNLYLKALKAIREQ